ncbi:hypothetical protein L1987_09847 [Smallanthus sonchifolius]|uniref:Uncharacterized protein n=1 Tax=Smallanthus sonchifolius TaxID=185202 RepID=A0ACB9JQH1_9ASTR|nr:hypothetical protein L1987_09847 [Smallanthus sonchifolius]
MTLIPYIIGMYTPPTSPVAQEPDVPTIPSQEPKKRRLIPTDNTIVYDEPFHVRVRGNQSDQRIERLTTGLGETDRVHDNLVAAFHELEKRVNVLEFDLGAAENRIEEQEAQLVAANAAGDA